MPPAALSAAARVPGAGGPLPARSFADPAPRLALRFLSPEPADGALLLDNCEPSWLPGMGPSGMPVAAAKASLLRIPMVERLR